MIYKQKDESVLNVGRILEYEVVNKEFPTFYHNQGDAGYDIYTSKTKWVWPFKITKIPVNVKIALPNNTFGLVTVRSCMCDKGIDVLNGIIDEPYRGVPHVATHRIGILPRRIKAGSRIAQLVIIPYVECHLVESKIKIDTERGNKGFGHTNKDS